VKWRRDQHERLVYHVESRGDAGHWHRVDLEYDDYRGGCSCEDFRYRRKKERREGGTGECSHIKTALVAFSRTVLQQIKEQARKAHGTSSSDVGPT
jgi:predicted nucleic acid-binding Zn finger protein